MNRFAPVAGELALVDAGGPQAFPPGMLAMLQQHAASDVPVHVGFVTAGRDARNKLSLLWARKYIVHYFDSGRFLMYDRRALGIIF